MQYHKYSLTEIENMIPWEREIYLALLENHIKEEEEKAAELAEINGKIDSAIEALESLRPVSEEEKETPPMQQSEVPFQEAKNGKKK